MGIHVPPISTIYTNMLNENASESSGCKKRSSMSLDDDHIPKMPRRMVNEEHIQNDLTIGRLNTTSQLDNNDGIPSIVTTTSNINDESVCNIVNDNDDQYLPAGSLSPVSLSSLNSSNVTTSSITSLSLPSQQHHTQNRWTQNHQSQQTIKCETNGKCYLDLGSGANSTSTSRTAVQQRTNSEPECCELGRCVPTTQCYKRLRTIIFDASMRKLGKSNNSGNGNSQQSCETGLRRSVLICNTLRLIEREMSREAASQQQINILQQYNNNNRRSPTPYPEEYRNVRPEIMDKHHSSSNSTTESIDSGVDNDYYYDDDEDNENEFNHTIDMPSNHQQINGQHMNYYNLNGNIVECDNFIHLENYDEDEDTNSVPMDHQTYDNNFNHNHPHDNTLPIIGNNTTITSIDWGSVLNLSSSNSNNSQSTSHTSITLMNNAADSDCEITSNNNRKSQQKHKIRNHYHYNQNNKHRNHQKASKRREYGISSSFVEKTKTSTSYHVLS